MVKYFGVKRLYINTECTIKNLYKITLSFLFSKGCPPQASKTKSEAVIPPQIINNQLSITDNMI